MTMSISPAPAATASRVSSTLTSSEVWPAGKPVATEATATPVPRSASAATGTSAGYTHTAAHEGISGRDGSGTTALAHRWRTLPGVSEPSSVVRSIIDVAMRMPSRLAVVLIERFPSAAARSSTPMRLTGVSERLRAVQSGRPREDARMDALVAGATRGAGRGIAVALGEAGATVYCTGRSTRGRRSEYDRPETIEDTAEQVSAAGGQGIAVVADHLDRAQVQALVARIDAEHGRLDVLVNDIWGAERLFAWETPLWEHDLDDGLRLLRLGVETHLITSHAALPLLIRRPGGLVVELTDGTRAYNDTRYRVNAFYDLAKAAVLRLAFAQSVELAPHGATAVALTPGWLRSEMMLENFGVTEERWRDAAAIQPHFAAISESPRFVGRAVAALAADPDVARHHGGSFSSGELARAYGFTDVDGSQPDCWRYMVEVQDPGLPADPTGYR